ncbi:hypothetical protein BC831DRAFT_253688 [Entophlyctis helioformis]|nr:hypothetical protein BC831DRAFT_253688 [Entophlyctis helioformis]
MARLEHGDVSTAGCWLPRWLPTKPPSSQGTQDQRRVAGLDAQGEPRPRQDRSGPRCRPSIGPASQRAAACRASSRHSGARVDCELCTRPSGGWWCVVVEAEGSRKGDGRAAALFDSTQRLVASGRVPASRCDQSSSADALACPSACPPVRGAVCWRKPCTAAKHCRFAPKSTKINQNQSSSDNDPCDATAVCASVQAQRRTNSAQLDGTWQPV